MQTLGPTTDWRHRACLLPSTAGSTSQLLPLLRHVNTYLARWARKKYKRLRSLKRFKAWWRGLTAREPELFAHWAWMRAYRWRG